MPLKECNYPLIWLVRFRLTARKDVFTINQQLLYHCCLDINLWPTPQPRLLKTLIFERNCTPRCLYKISAAHTLYQESLKGYSFYGFCLFRKKKKKKKPLQTSPHTIVYTSVHLLSDKKYKSTAIPVAYLLQDGPSSAGCFEQKPIHKLVGLVGFFQLAPR